jgi:hypothetical protein
VDLTEGAERHGDCSRCCSLSLILGAEEGSDDAVAVVEEVVGTAPGRGVAVKEKDETEEGNIVAAEVRCSCSLEGYKSSVGTDCPGELEDMSLKGFAVDLASQVVGQVEERIVLYA